MFHFSGNIPLSKSWLNRALILRSWEPKMSFDDKSDADDVVKLKQALADFEQGLHKFDVGHGGTTFRFFVIRASRIPGSYFIKASKSLMARPQIELSKFLDQVGVKSEWSEDGIRMVSHGWIDPEKPVEISGTESSQFLSSVLLSSMDLDFDISLSTTKGVKSESYLSFTLDLLKKSGLFIRTQESSNLRTFTIPKNSKLKKVELKAELDMSSAFSLAACGVAGGDVSIKNWTAETLQPDRQFVEIFSRSGISFSIDESTFKVQHQKFYSGVDFNIADCPDLFPVLCALFSGATTKSRFFGAPHLKIKESNRIDKTHELLSLCGLSCEKLDDGLIVDPTLNRPVFNKVIFDPANDHRMAMAAAVLKLRGFSIEILHPEVVNKSYPDFFRHIQMSESMSSS